jgi:hypothetical protein
MRKRWEGQMHPVTKPIILIGYGLAVIWVLWVTLVAFTGGTLPVVGWEVEGGIIWGVLSIACLWPIASILFFLVFQALDVLAWWLDDKFHKPLKEEDQDRPG